MWKPFFSRCPVLAILGVLLFTLATPAEEPKPAQDALRYDGKTFDYWKNYPRTELKPERRTEAIRAMVAFGNKGRAAEAAACIIEVVKDYGEDAYYTAPQTPERELVGVARGAMWQLGTPAFDLLVDHVKDAKVLRFASNVFDHWERPPFSKAAIQKLIRAVLHEDDADVRIAALGLLSKYARPDDETRKELVELLGQDADRFVQRLIEHLDAVDDWRALLLTLGPRAQAAAPAVLKHRGYGYLQTLEAIFPQREKLIALVATGLNNPDAKAQSEAAEWLGQQGPGAGAAYPALIHLLQHRDVDLRKTVIQALAAIAAEPGATVAALERLAADRDEPLELRIQALTALPRFGAKANDALPVLLRIIGQDEEAPSVRVKALNALMLFKEVPANQVAPCLIGVVDRHMQAFPQANYLQQRDTGLAWAASTEEWEADRMTALAALSLDYLVRLGAGASDATPVLIRAFKQYDRDEQRRPLIAQALGKMGPAARDALPILREAAKSSNPRLRGMAAQAIEEISRTETRP